MRLCLLTAAAAILIFTFYGTFSLNQIESNSPTEFLFQYLYLYEVCYTEGLQK